jgi:hypothetical protein
MYDYDFDNRMILTDYVYGKWNKKVKSEVLDTLDGLSDEDFRNYVKTYWVIGKSVLDECDCSIFDLYKNWGRSRSDLLRAYFKLLGVYTPDMLESSLLTFLEKSVDFENISASGYYMKLLKEFRDRNLNKIKSVLFRYAVIDEPKDMKVLWLLLQF